MIRILKFLKEELDDLGDDLSKTLFVYATATTEILEEKAFLEKKAFRKSIGGDYHKASYFYDTYLAREYFMGAFKRRQKGKMTPAEEFYLLNTNVIQITQDYLQGKMDDLSNQKP